MRSFVVGQTRRDDYGRCSVDLHIRVLIPDETVKPGRRAYYEAQQVGYISHAPQGGLSADDWALEQAELRAGHWVELPPISVPVDPAWSNAEIQKALSSTAPSVLGAILAFLAQKHSDAYNTRDDERFGFYGLSA